MLKNYRIFSQQSRIHAFIAWGIVVCFLVTDLIWFPESKLRFDPSNISRLATTSLLIVGIIFVTIAIRYRLRSDRSKLGRITTVAADRVGLLAQAGAFVVAIVATGVTFSYLSTSLSLPLWDGDLAAIDRAMGLNWLEVLTWSNDRPWLAHTLRFSYQMAGLELITVYLFLSLSGRREHLMEFNAIFALTSLLTGIGMTLVPAEGAYAFYHPTFDQISNYGPEAVLQTWKKAFVDLRTNTAPILNFARAEGLVTFPSFHTVVAIITCYAIRTSRILLLPMIGFNFLMLFATVTSGGHHFVDIAAGGVVAGVAIFVAALARGSSYRSPHYSESTTASI